MSKNYEISYRDSGSVIITCSDGRESDPVGYQGIAQLDDVYATSDYYRGCLPALFRVTTIQDHPKYIKD